MTTATLQMLSPEILLVAVAIAIYMGGTFGASRRTWAWAAGMALAAAAGLLAMQTAGHFECRSFCADRLAWDGRWFFLATGALLLMLTVRADSSRDNAEGIASLVLIIVGAMLTAAANELILIFLGLELISIPTYILLYLGRRDAASQEATTKYFFLSVLASAVMLYGFSFLYGAAGTTELMQVRSALNTLDTAKVPFQQLALAMIFAGLCFKITAVPFHFYAPDVYQGTTHANAALLSVVPKAAGLLVLIRILLVAMPHMAILAWPITAVVAALSMTLGNVMALWQEDLRRMLAYSSIANAGYMLIGLAVALATGNAADGWNGLAALGFYLVAYALATIGAFAAFEYLGRAGRSLDNVEELAGLGNTRPLAAMLLGIFMFSLAGVPPLAGFWGKLFIFGSAIGVENAARPWLIALAILGVLNAAVAAAYYLRIVTVMYFRTPLAKPKAEGGRGPWVAAVLCGLLIVAIGVFPGILTKQTQNMTGPQKMTGPPLILQERPCTVLAETRQ